MREYGLGQLAADEDSVAIRHAFAAIMLAFAEASSEGFASSKRRLWDRARVDDELPNLREAFQWSAAQGAFAAELPARLASNLWAYWHTTGRATEGRAWYERALAMTAAPEWVRALNLTGLALLCWAQGADARVTEVLDEAEPLAERLGLIPTQAVSWFYRALIAWRGGPAQVFTMLDYLERALALFEQAQEPIGLGVCKLALGQIGRLTGNPAEALTLFDEAQAGFEEAGYEWGLATAYYYGGEARRDLAAADPSLLPDAIDRLRRGLDAYWQLGDGWGSGGVVAALARVAADRGDDDRAARLFGAAQSLLGRTGAFLPPSDLEAYEAAATSLRDRMGTARYDTAFAAGRALPPDIAVQEALALTRPPDNVFAALTNIQRSLLRDILKWFPDPDEFTVKELATRRGRTFGSVHKMLTDIAELLDLHDWRELPPFVLTHRQDLA